MKSGPPSPCPVSFPDIHDILCMWGAESCVRTKQGIQKHAYAIAFPVVPLHSSYAGLPTAMLSFAWMLYILAIQNQTRTQEAKGVNHL